MYVKCSRLAIINIHLINLNNTYSWKIRCFGLHRGPKYLLTSKNIKSIIIEIKKNLYYL